MYIYAYIHIYAHIHSNIHIYIYVHIYVYIYIYAYVYIYLGVALPPFLLLLPLPVLPHFGFRDSDFGSRVTSFGFRVSRFGVWFSRFWCRASRFGFWDSRLGFRVSRFRFRVPLSSDLEQNQTVEARFWPWPLIFEVIVKKHCGVPFSLGSGRNVPRDSAFSPEDPARASGSSGTRPPLPQSLSDFEFGISGFGIQVSGFGFRG